MVLLWCATVNISDTGEGLPRPPPRLPPPMRIVIIMHAVFAQQGPLAVNQELEHAEHLWEGKV